MPSIVKQLVTTASIDQVWSALRDVEHVHTRLAIGFVVDTMMAEPDLRVVTFADGRVARERIVAIDDHERRVVWTIEEGVATHYNGAAQAFEETDGRARLVWTTDFLPAALGEFLDAAMSQGIAAMQHALDTIAVAPTTN